MTNPCEELIIQQIQDQGPITIETFMELALHHPEHGYYAKAPAIGADADFVTSPEVSQMFGEVIGAWCVDMWYKMSSPSAFNLVELGPGRGTLMKDVIRVGQNVEGFISHAHVTLVEKNHTLRDIQKQSLKNIDVTWVDDFSSPEIKDLPTLIIANEFFDAFPVQQYERLGPSWCEKYVALQDGTLNFLTKPVKIQPKFLEQSPKAEAYFQNICQRICRTTGAILIIDYGYENGKGHTLQSLRGHDFNCPLSNIGEADLTAHVNFGALSHLAQEEGLAVTSLITQGRFLSALGILERSQQLQAQNPQKIPEIMSELMRLTHPQQMGSLFKVMSAYSSHLKEPEGFK